MTNNGEREASDEINVVCVGDIQHRYFVDDIQTWDFDYSDQIMRIDFKSGSFVEFYKRNIIRVEYVKFEKGA